MTTHVSQKQAGDNMSGKSTKYELSCPIFVESGLRASLGLVLSLEVFSNAQYLVKFGYNIV